MIARAVLVVVALAVIGAVVAGFAAAPPGALDTLLDNVWGRVTLADLYGSFAVLGVVIFALEPSRTRALGWTLALLLLGSPVAALWLLVSGLARCER